MAKENVALVAEIAIAVAAIVSIVVLVQGALAAL